ncbi:hypothetical protein [Streptosporangium vulgare]|uniref:DUF2493 domain-containing protein n=1 Tax=Streptosporangium vulgare TaxID=46190 RepID=A0ABV5TQ68_9ACTN
MIFRILGTGARALKHEDAGPLYGALADTQHDVTQLGGRMLVVQGACYPKKRADGSRPAESADWLMHLWCEANGVPDEPHPADWANCTPLCPDKPHRKTRYDGTEYCPLAGHWRNQDMADLGAHLCIAAPVGRSTGTYDCMRRAKAAGIPVWPVTK